MDEKMQQIIIKAGEVFMRYGIKSVNMDDIARELKMSKKTLYKYVSDKLDLVVKVMHTHCVFEELAIKAIIEESKNAIDEMVEINKHVSDHLNAIHPSIHYDLEKYYPEAWALFHEHENTFVLSCIKDNLHRGVEEGLYRDNLNVDIMAKIYVAKIDIVFDHTVFSPREYKFVEVLNEMLRYHIRGIASEKGVKYLKEKVNTNGNNF